MNDKLLPMSDEEKQVIQNFASNVYTAREKAIEIYRRYKNNDIEAHSLHMRFMSEVDTPVPDLERRNKARKDLFALINSSTVKTLEPERLGLKRIKVK